MYVSFAVGEVYHPNASLGDLLRPLKEAALFFPIIVIVFVFLLWQWRRPLSDKPYEIGLVLLIVAMILPWFPRIDSGFRQEYWLAQHRMKFPGSIHPSMEARSLGGGTFS
ncbi:MFS superfamily sulfate permease-like transporter [Labrenzia sp. EL_159]|nr:MFS superfamily sulfate permease-like transporter [Labrenzia sp. EL_159]